MHSIRAFGAAALVSTVVSTSAAAQDPVFVEGLGATSFPTSGADAAQAEFVRGVLLMHSFEYETAAEHFQKAREIDPDFVMAYWGEAMTHVHPVWNEKDVEAARAVLAELGPSREARLAKAPTERERMYLEAAEVMYGEGEKAALDTAYAQAMGRLVEAFPDDDEAKAFRALALLGLSQGDRNVPTYMRAGAIALDLFERNAQHPGAAHYAIHSFDDPTHAPLGLEAARAYGPIAPEAGHAQHMTTHIFLALGMWQDLIDANERASAVVSRQFARPGVTLSCGHYNEWLQYGYEQQGRYDDARTLLASCYDNYVGLEERFRPRSANSYAYMRALYLVDTEASHDGEVTAEVDTTLLGQYAKNALDFGTAFAALRQGDRGTATRLHEAMNARQADPNDWGYAYAPIHVAVIGALIQQHDGDHETALHTAHAGAELEAALPFDFGPPLALKPPRELEAELLYDMGRYEEALTAFEFQLARTPDRARTLLGYARTAAKLHKGDRAEWAYARLMEHWANADPTRPELIEARAATE